MNAVEWGIDSLRLSFELGDLWDQNSHLYAHSPLYFNFGIFPLFEFLKYVFKIVI